MGGYTSGNVEKAHASALQEIMAMLGAFETLGQGHAILASVQAKARSQAS
jgi:hypothetical protein